MNTAAATLGSTRDPFMPRRPPGMRAGLLLALLAHALLIVGLAVSVDWHSVDSSAVEAELWSTLPQPAAPRAVAPPPPAPALRRPEPAATPPRPQPVQTSAPPPVDPQIAIEKTRQAKQAQVDRELAEQDQARRDKARRERAQQDAQARQQAEHDRQQRKEQQAKEEQARKKLLAEKAEKTEKIEKADRIEKAEKAEKTEKAEKDKTDRAAAAAQQAAARAAYLKRMQGMAGASGDSGSTGTAAKSSGPSAGYAGRIMARIKPNIVFPDAVEGNPTATVEVRVAADGSITSRRLVQSSGVKAWDDAVLRAIDRTDGLPRDVDGRVQPVMLIAFKRD